MSRAPCAWPLSTRPPRAPAIPHPRPTGPCPPAFQRGIPLFQGPAVSPPGIEVIVFHVERHPVQVAPALIRPPAYEVVDIRDLSPGAAGLTRVPRLRRQPHRRPALPAPPGCCEPRASRRPCCRYRPRRTGRSPASPCRMRLAMSARHETTCHGQDTRSPRAGSSCPKRSHPKSTCNSGSGSNSSFARQRKSCAVNRRIGTAGAIGASA